MGIIPPPSICPTCGTPPTSSAVMEHDRLPIAACNFLCDSGHIWAVRWVLEEWVAS